MIDIDIDTDTNTDVLLMLMLNDLKFEISKISGKGLTKPPPQTPPSLFLRLRPIPVPQLLTLGCALAIAGRIQIGKWKKITVFTVFSRFLKMHLPPPPPPPPRNKHRICRNLMEGVRGALHPPPGHATSHIRLLHSYQLLIVQLVDLILYSWTRKPAFKWRFDESPCTKYNHISQHAVLCCARYLINNRAICCFRIYTNAERSGCEASRSPWLMIPGCHPMHVYVSNGRTCSAWI